MATDDGRIGPKVAAVLKNLNLLSDEDKGAWVGADRQSLNVLFAAGIPAVPPVLAIFAGDIDLRASVCRQFNVSFDFDLDEIPSEPRQGVRKVPQADVERLLLAKLSPIFTGVRALQAAGFTRTYVTMVPPPSLEDEKTFLKLHGFSCPLSLRRKLTSLANRTLARLAATSGTPFVDVSDVVTTDGLLAEPYRLDGFHMTTDAGMKIISKIIDHAANHTARHFNASLYEHAKTYAEPARTMQEPAFAQAQSEFNRQGIISRQIDITEIEESMAGVDFEEDVGNRHSRLTWCGNSRTPFNPMMRNLTPGKLLLKAVYDVVYSQATLPLFQACVGSDVHFINTRFFMSLPHDGAPVGPQTFHHDGCPPGVIRALIYLVDVDIDNGPFEHLDSGGNSHLAVGKKGTLLIFDANRLLHRGSPPRQRFRKVIDFCVAPLPAGSSRRVMWAGMNNWPMDPFQVQVEGMLAYPEFQRSWLRTYPFASETLKRNSNH